MIYIYSACWVISLILLYYIIKAAVRNGMLEANEHLKTSNSITPSRPEKLTTAYQEKLKQQYDRGEIGFEEYQKQWKSAE